MLAAYNINDKKIFYALAALYALCMYVAVGKGMDYLMMLPLLLLIISIGLLNLKLLFYICIVAVPFAINLSETGFGIGVSLPSEPLLFGCMILLVFKFIYDGGIDRRFFRHPVSILILLHLVWMVITTVTSEMTVVSVKYTLARFTFVMVCYYYAGILFSNRKEIGRFYWLYLIVFLGVVAYTITNHALQFFTEQAAHTAMTPFYNDHTAYAAAVALFLPLTVSVFLCNAYSVRYRFWAFVVFAVLLVAIVLSYTRASWIGVAAAFAVSFVFIFRIPGRMIWMLSGLVVLFLLINGAGIFVNLETNREQSSDDFASHFQSMTNVRTDPSNVERINRWSCAVRMFLDKPFTGYGPGTYQFIYGNYQINWQRTVISTNAGNRGNAHSEYLGPLSEQGVPAPLLFIAIAVVTIVTASRFIISTKDKKMRALAIGLILGLVTYWVHGFLNNFLDTEKLSVPYWAFIAAIVALDVFHKYEISLNSKKSGT